MLRRYLPLLALALLLLASGCITVVEKVHSDGTADLIVRIDADSFLAMAKDPDAAWAELKDRCEQSPEKLLEDASKQGAQVSGIDKQYFAGCRAIEEDGRAIEFLYTNVPVEEFNQSFEKKDKLYEVEYILSATANAAIQPGQGPVEIYIEMPGEVYYTSVGEIKDNRVLLKGDAKEGYTIKSKESRAWLLAVGAVVVVGAAFFLWKRAKG